MKNEVVIFDTTLRDGEQTPGATLLIDEKVEIARQLAALGVDVIEAGFPYASPGDYEAVQLVSKEIRGPRIAGLARALPADIEKAWDALRHAEKARIHTFISTSDIQIEHQLKKTRDEVVQMAVDAVTLARSYCDDVEFSAMDATRSDWDFLCRIFGATIAAGAGTINVPDTVGYTLPDEFGELIRYLKENTPGIDDVVVSVHCHNDLGLAVANSMAAIRNGARQVECTVNGIGERAGNASLEEIVMIVDTHRDTLGLHTNIVTEEIARSSRMVSRLTGIPVQPNKAIVGVNAFAHESGIHQDAVLKERTTFEIIDPARIGLSDSRMVLGKLSGRHAFRARLEELGYRLDDDEVNTAFERFKDLTARKKEVTDRDIEAVVALETIAPAELFRLEAIQVFTGTGLTPTATVTLRRNDETMQEAACGDGPVDAAYRAIDRITGMRPVLDTFVIQAVTEGKDALGEVSVTLDIDDRRVSGRGVSTDIIEASARAYLSAINRYLAFKATETDS